MLPLVENDELVQILLPNCSLHQDPDSELRARTRRQISRLAQLLLLLQTGSHLKWKCAISAWHNQMSCQSVMTIYVKATLYHFISRRESV